MKKKNITRGKKARASGSRFELKVRSNLESKGWIVDRWTNNVEFHNNEDVNEFPFTTGKLISAKPKTLFINGKRIIINMWTGFPDFITFRWIWKVDLEKALKMIMVLESAKSYPINGMEDYVKDFMMWEIVGIECKSKGYLDKEEKKKAKWLLDNNVFSKIFIASKGKKRGTIKYKEFEQ